MTVKNNAKAMVLYTDGGCRPNPGFGGWGIHGYTWQVQKNIKGVGHSTHAATARGYEFKAESKQVKLTPEWLKAYEEGDLFDQIDTMRKMASNKERITVDEFVDAYGTLPGNEQTNNTSEIHAMMQGIQIAIDKGINFLLVRADSNLVVNGTMEWMDNWARNNWITSKGSAVSNSDLWASLIAIRDKFRTTGGVLEVQWVKGHDTDIGNNSADWMATIAVYASQKHRILSQTDYTAGGTEYWGSAGDKRHPMLNHRYAYFVADPNMITKGTYYVGSQGKEVELIAKRSAEAGYAVIQVDEGDKALDFVIQHQCSLKNELMSMCMVDLDSLFGPSYRYTNLYREDFLYRPLSHRYDLRAVDESPITRELRPPVIAMRAIDAMVRFSMILEDFLEQTGTAPTSTDITDVIYTKEIVPAKGKAPELEVMSIRSEFSVGLTHIKVPANVHGLKDPIDLVLTSNIDMPDRNTLKRIEHLNPKVHVITWGSDPLCFHYATVIVADGCRGIWAGAFSNMRVLAEPRGL